MPLSIQSLYFSRANKEILYNINLFAQEGKILCLLGPSGSGKTTLLRLIAGLEKVTKGSVMLDNKILSDKSFSVAPQERSIGFVFQENNLFPHLNTFENIEFGLKNLIREERKDIIKRISNNMHLDEIITRYPDTLSGGQKQRVALAQAMARTPRVMLLDEPFSNVDPQLRTSLRNQTRKILVSSNVISIFVTHDPLEAIDIADYIGVIEDGTLHQLDTAANVWSNPKSKQVLMAFGDCYKIKAKIIDGKLEGPFGKIKNIEGNKLSLPEVFIRPHSFSFHRKSMNNNDIKIKVKSLIFKGNFQGIKFNISEETFFSYVDDSIKDLKGGDDLFINTNNIRYYIF